MPLVSKLPALVAVWVVLLVLVKATRAPRFTFSVPGWKAKLTMETVLAPLAFAVGSAAPPPLAAKPARASGTRATRSRSVGPLSEVVMTCHTEPAKRGFKRRPPRAIMVAPGG